MIFTIHFWMENNISSAPACDCHHLKRHAYRDNRKTAIFKRWVYRRLCFKSSLIADELKVFVRFWT